MSYLTFQLFPFSLNCLSGRNHLCFFTDIKILTILKMSDGTVHHTEGKNTLLSNYM